MEEDRRPTRPGCIARSLMGDLRFGFEDEWDGFALQAHRIPHIVKCWLLLGLSWIA